MNFAVGRVVIILWGEFAVDGVVILVALSLGMLHKPF